MESVAGEDDGRGVQEVLASHRSTAFGGERLEATENPLDVPAVRANTREYAVDDVGISRASG